MSRVVYSIRRRSCGKSRKPQYHLVRYVSVKGHDDKWRWRANMVYPPASSRADALLQMPDDGYLMEGIRHNMLAPQV